MKLIDDTKTNALKVNSPKKDGRAHKCDVDDTRDHHLDFDMFDYIYSLLVTVDGFSTVLNPLDHPIKKFDRPKTNQKVKDKEFDPSLKMAEDEASLHPRVTVEDDKIFLASDTEEDFADVIAICDLYNIKHSNPTKHGCSLYYWDWNMTIDVPMSLPGFPMLLEDYFNSIEVPLEKVMPQKWVTSYRSKCAKLEKERQAELNQMKFDRIFNDAVTYAWLRGDISLEAHCASFIKALKAAGVAFKPTLTKHKFMAEFEEDDYEEETLVAVDLFA